VEKCFAKMKFSVWSHILYFMVILADKLWFYVLCQDCIYRFYTYFNILFLCEAELMKCFSLQHWCCNWVMIFLSTFWEFQCKNDATSSAVVLLCQSKSPYHAILKMCKCSQVFILGQNHAYSRFPKRTSGKKEEQSFNKSEGIIISSAQTKQYSSVAHRSQRYSERKNLNGDVFCTMTQSVTISKQFIAGHIWM